MVGACILAGCAGLGGPPTVTLGAGELDALLQRRLPLQQRVLEVFDLTLPAARLQLLPDRNRLSLAMDLGVRERMLGASWQGRIVLDSALRWEAGDQTVRLNQVKVLDLKVNPGSSAGSGAVERIGAAIAERVLEDLVVYRLPPERAAQLKLVGLAPAAVTVTSRGVEITFGPANRQAPASGTGR